MSSTHNYCRLYIAPSIDIGFSISKECGQVRKHEKTSFGWISGGGVSCVLFGSSIWSFLSRGFNTNNCFVFALLLVSLFCLCCVVVWTEYLVCWMRRQRKQSNYDKSISCVRRRSKTSGSKVSAKFHKQRQKATMVEEERGERATTSAEGEGTEATIGATKTEETWGEGYFPPEPLVESSLGRDLKSFVYLVSQKQWRRNMVEDKLVDTITIFVNDMPVRLEQTACLTMSYSWTIP